MYVPVTLTAHTHKRTHCPTPTHTHTHRHPDTRIQKHVQRDRKREREISRGDEAEKGQHKNNKATHAATHAATHSTMYRNNFGAAERDVRHAHRLRYGHRVLLSPCVLPVRARSCEIVRDRGSWSLQELMKSFVRFALSEFVRVRVSLWKEVAQVCKRV